MFDLFPTAALLFFLFLLVSTDSDQTRDSGKTVAGLIFLAIFLPLSNGIWLQFSAFRLIRRITERAWREEVWMTGITAHEYLVAQLRTRVYTQIIPFGLAFGCCALAALASLPETLQRSDALNYALLGGSIIFAIAAMQFSALCVVLLGLLQRILAHCRPDHSAMTLHWTAFKWSAVVFFAPLLFLGAAFFLVLMTEEILLGTDYENIVIAAILTGLSSFVSWFFYRRLKRRWHAAQNEFFQFE